MTKASPFNSAASLGKPKSILPIISSTSKDFSFNGDCFALLLSPGFFTWRNHLFGYFSSCLFFTIHTVLVLNKQRTIALQIKVLRWGEKKRGRQRRRRAGDGASSPLICLFVYLLKLGGVLKKGREGGGGGWERGQKNMRRSDEVKIDCANTA